MSFSIVSAWSLLAIVLLVIVLKKKNNKPKNLPPGPPGLPITGNLHQIGTLPHRSFHLLSRQYGPLFFLKLGRVPTVVASSADTASQILKTHDVHCCTRPSLSVPGRLTYNYTDLVFSPYDDYWRELRKICTLELYSTKRVQSFRNIRLEEVATFVDSLNKSALTQTPFNFGKNLLSLSGSVICRLGFGINLRVAFDENSGFTNFDGLTENGGDGLFRDSVIGKDGFEDLITGAMGILGSFALADFFPYVGWIMDRLSGLHARKEKIFHALDEFYEQAIALHLNRNKEDGQDIIDLLLKIEKEQSGFGGFRLTRNHIKGILMNIILAGIDTSALTVEWVMARLMTNSRVLKKVQAEVRDRIKNKDTITEESIEQLEYLKMVIKEIFRLHPLVATLVPREAMTDIKINGYDIPAKTRIEINAWAIGHDPEVWKDPEEFLPERFLDNDIDYKGQNFELLPFGSGRRMCPGMNMGMALVHMTLINILYRFDWKLPEGMTEKDVSFEEKSGLVIGKKIPLELIPVRTRWT